jgi:hypothetical protein
LRGVGQLSVHEKLNEEVRMKNEELRTEGGERARF